MYFDFGWIPDFSVEPPDKETVFNEWFRHSYLERAIGGQVNPVERLRPQSSPFIVGAERARFRSSFYESGNSTTLEAGIGVTNVNYWNHWASAYYKETTQLLWARVGGIEYGRQVPTVTTVTSWAEVKSGK